MAPAALADLRERFRRLYALSFYDTQPPRFLEGVRTALLAASESVKALDVFLDTHDEEFSDLDPLATGLWEYLGRLQGTLSPWIDNPLKSADHPTEFELQQPAVLSALGRDQAILSFYAFLFDTALDAVEASRGQDDAGSRPASGRRAANRLHGAVANFIAGCPNLDASSSPRSIPCETPLDIDDRKVYGSGLGIHLTVSMKESFGKIPAEEARLSQMFDAAVYWSKRSVDGMRLLASNGSDASDLDHLEVTAAQAYLDTIKAAKLLGACLGQKLDSPQTEIVPLILERLSRVVLDNLDKFYQTVFSVPNYEMLLDIYDRTMSTPLSATDPRQSRSTSTSKNYTLMADLPAASRHQDSGSSGASGLEGSRVGASSSRSSVSNDRLSMERNGGALGHQMPHAAFFDILTSSPVVSHRRRDSGNLASIPPTPRVREVQTPPPRPPEMPEPQLPSNFASALPLRNRKPIGTLPNRSFSETGKEVVAPPPPAQPGSQAWVDYPRVPNIRTDRHREERNGPTRGDTATDRRREEYESTQRQPSLTQHLRADSDLHVMMKEQALIRKRIEDVESADDETEIFNENVVNSSNNFYSGILSTGRTQYASQSVFVPSKIRLFRQMQDCGLHMWTEWQVSCAQPVNDHLLSSGAELVPVYAFVDDSTEGAEVYFRYNGAQVGFKYKFVVDPTGRSALHGFQGAALGMLFEEEYQLASTTFNRSMMAKDEVLRHPLLQFWSARSEPLGAHSAGQRGSIESVHSDRAGNLASKDVSLDDLESFRNNMDCSWLFIYSKTPKTSIYVLFIDDRVVLRHPPNPLFGNRNPDHSLQLVPDKNKGIDRLRIREIGGSSPGIPLNLEDLKHRDQDGPRFTDYKSIQFGFHSRGNCDAFLKVFNELKAGFEEKLVLAYKLKQHQRHPHIRVVSSSSAATVTGAREVIH